MEIRPILVVNNVDNSKQEHKKKKSSKSPSENSSVELRSQFNDHLITFKARVDKGLDRFYNYNKNRMPSTFRRYIESLEDKTRLTPIQAQKRAFIKLEDAKTPDDIKKFFPDEELFTDLVEYTETKSTRGILQSAKENKELLELSNEGLLKDNTDLTVYLVKKIFLEAKTLEEINNDLENDLNEDFKADFKFKNEDAKYIYHSTLKALGIKPPSQEYQQSLRYTRSGYSDSVGDNISMAQRKFWDSLSPEERTARAKKSVEKFETWWNSHSNNEKLDMIADQLTTLEMLKDFKKMQRAEAKKQTEPESQKNIEETPRPRTKIGSNKLSQDELFIKWATNHLKIYEANLSEAEKDTLHIKRMQRLTERWAGMNPAEKTEYISKMKSGSEPLRYTMIDAWNNSKDVIKDLSEFLKSNQIYKPSDLLYSSEQFSQLQSELMTEFWSTHPEHSTTLGKNIKLSQQKVQMAIQRGTFEELKKQIMRDKNQRIKEIEKYKSPQKQFVQNNSPENTRPEYMQEFMSLYKGHERLGIADMPKEYWDDFFDVIQESNEEFVKIWTKQLKGEYVTPQEEAISLKHRMIETPKSAKISRAIETAMASAVYDCVKDPRVFMLSTTDLKTIIFHIQKGNPDIMFKSHQLNQDFSFHVKNKNLDTKKIEKLYHTYKEELSENQLDAIADYYFFADSYTDKDAKNNLKEYIKTYGKSALIMFSLKSTYPANVKKAMFQKFLNRIPSNLSIYTISVDFEHEDKIKAAKLKYENKLDYIPKDFINLYFNELGKELRKPNAEITVEEFEQKCCKKRKTIFEHSPIAYFPKTRMRTEVKLETLAMEEALADVLYDCTGNIDVYSMKFEELCSNLELFRLCKKFPSEPRNYSSVSLNKDISLRAVKKPNTTGINRLYKEYLNNITEWVNEDVSNSPEKPDLVELLYCLNPDENMPDKDKAVVRRIKEYGLNLILKPPVENYILEALSNSK